MRIFKTSHPEEGEEQLNPAAAPVIAIDDFHHGLKYLVDLVKQIRPKRYDDHVQAELKFKALFYQLQNDKQMLTTLRQAVISIFKNHNIVPALTESGMVGSRGFLQELIVRIKHKLLPPLPKQNDFLYVINHVFYKKHDYVWVERLDVSLWVNFFKTLGIQLSYRDEDFVKQLNVALHILAQRTVTLGLENDIFNALPVDDYENYPFLKLDRAAQCYLQFGCSDIQRPPVIESIQQIVDTIREFKALVDVISENRRKNGTSLSQTYLLFRIQQHLDRLLLITDVLDGDNDFNLERFLKYFIKVVSYENTKTSLREFTSANFSFLAYKITEHGGTRGEKYITATRKDYWLMIISAMGGGFIVSVTALIKNLITKAAFPPFWQGFAYSTNYALGFQLMHETNTTLATKQPAFTASSLAGSLDYFKEYRKPDMYALVITIARTSRSQIASFFGNLIIVFPFAYLLAYLYHTVTGHLLLNTEAAHKTLVDQHPYLSFSLLYACFTGVFLFLSGLIAGYIDNGINYGRVGERLRNHPVLKHSMSSKRLTSFTRYVENHFGALMGNIALGFFLGMAGFFGHIFGFPFDIRHITIAAGNSAIAFYTQGHLEDKAFLFTVFIGILLIGFFNFIVSFFLAFFVAIKSRGVRLKDYPELLTIVSKFIIHYPLDFFFPPKYPREVDEIKRRFGFKIKPIVP